MKLNYKTALLASSLALSGIFPALAQETAKPPLPKVEASGGETAGKALKPTDVMAVIDGKPMTVAEVDEWAKLIVPRGDEGSFTRRVQTLQALITLKAFARAGEAEKLDATEAYKQRMALLSDSTLQQLYVAGKLETPASDADIKARYDKEIGSMPKEVEIHARHILVKSEDEAKALIARLQKGEDFEKLAKETSTDGVAAIGGDLGYFTKGQMVPEFDEAAFALKAGEYSKTPVKTPYGWHVIKVEDVRTKEPPTLEEAKPYIQNLLMTERYVALQKEVIAKLKVTYPDADIAKAVSRAAQEADNQEDFE